MYTKGDFHMHTTNSDGEYTPTEVVIMGKEKGLDIMAITDHNTMNGVEEAIEIGKMIKLIYFVISILSSFSINK